MYSWARPISPRVPGTQHSSPMHFRHTFSHVVVKTCALPFLSLLSLRLPRRPAATRNRPSTAGRGYPVSHGSGINVVSVSILSSSLFHSSVRLCHTMHAHPVAWITEASVQLGAANTLLQALKPLSQFPSFTYLFFRLLGFSSLTPR